MGVTANRTLSDFSITETGAATQTVGVDESHSDTKWSPGRHLKEPEDGLELESVRTADALLAALLSCWLRPAEDTH